jgi:aminoglycoside 3-N-acetyltransferase
MVVTYDDLRAAICSLDLSGSVICVHSSLRSFGEVEGGGNYGAAQTVVNAMLDEACTLVVPTFSRWYEVAPPENAPARNGMKYEELPDWFYQSNCMVLEQHEITSYTPDTRLVSIKEMGIIPFAVVQTEGRVRGNHPLISFSALGPRAAEVVTLQQPLDPYALFDVVDFILMMGTPLERMSLIHYAEQRAGRTLFRRWVHNAEGDTIAVAIGGCCGCSEGFGNLMSALLPLARETTVGKSLWRVFPTQPTLEAAATAIRNDPYLIHCADPDCERCNDSMAGGPIL